MPNRQQQPYLFLDHSSLHNFLRTYTWDKKKIEEWPLSHLIFFLKNMLAHFLTSPRFSNEKQLKLTSKKPYFTKY